MSKYNEERKRSYNVMEKITGSIEALNAIQITQKVAGLDIACKTILKNKEFLAVILKYVAEEYKECTISEIMDFIEKETITSPELTTGRTNTQIAGDNLEFSQLNEKTSKFDILFRVKDPKLSTEEIQVNLMVDIEPQKNYQPGYPIEKRGIYYCSRMISSQISNVIVEDTSYKDIIKVYSIWICLDNVPQKGQYTMSHYEIVNTQNIGNYIPKKKNYDLLHMVIIRLGNKDYKEKQGIFEFLNALFYPENKNSYEKLNEYVDFSKNEELKKEVKKMSGLGQRVLEEGIEEGIIQGKIQMIISLLKDGYITKKMATEKLNITEEKLEELISKNDDIK